MRRRACGIKEVLSDLIAFFANGIDSVPVERPQDIATVGKGIIEQWRRPTIRVVVHGQDTSFMQACKRGDQFLVTKGPCKGAVAKILEVVSDSVAVVADNAFSGVIVMKSRRTKMFQMRPSKYCPKSTRTWSIRPSTHAWIRMGASVSSPRAAVA